MEPTARPKQGPRIASRPSRPASPVDLTCAFSRLASQTLEPDFCPAVPLYRLDSVPCYIPSTGRPVVVCHSPVLLYPAVFTYSCLAGTNQMKKAIARSRPVVSTHCAPIGPHPPTNEVSDDSRPVAG